MREQQGLDLHPRQAPRSIGTNAGIHPDDTNSLTDSLYDPALYRRQPSGVVRRDVRVTHHPALPSVPQRTSRYPNTTGGPNPNVPQLPPGRNHSGNKKHPLFYIGGGLALILTGSFLLNMLTSWANTEMDQLHYGYPRTYQTNIDVGHGGISHFTVENLGGHIVVYELPSTDVTKAVIYSGPTLSGGNADLAAAVVTFADVNGDGRIDMILEVDNTKYLFISGDDGKFHEQGG
jgi:hypothetical protein